ncbi:hypothetical protein BS50DRAFT_397834 [Corynespora cassiicola Philippines]|uniref:Uncharacterized protein n=1 Tax=Corynespora cassiicola Philippines TaxID=1448308 RepID=A0A2T2NK70_CORCC|nr:hypothetical protein BS50DRAFT_397834 [Corynespora cassiicola Philippines]
MSQIQLFFSFSLRVELDVLFAASLVARRVACLLACYQPFSLSSLSWVVIGLGDARHVTSRQPALCLQFRGTFGLQVQVQVQIQMHGVGLGCVAAVGTWADGNGRFSTFPSGRPLEGGRAGVCTCMYVCMCMHLALRHPVPRRRVTAFPLAGRMDGQTLRCESYAPHTLHTPSTHRKR